MALGAQRGNVLGLVLGQGVRLMAGGMALGVVAALALTRLMASLLYGITATDPTTFFVVTAILALVAFLASYIPARHATRVSPMVALRYE
jgi:ABC-type antimicrobial peptide transport system permease subunit